MNDLDPVQRSDQQLVAALAAGDNSATAELAQRYASDLYDFAIRIVLDGAAAAAVVEAVLDRVAEDAANKPAFLGFRAWLLGQVRDAALETLRQRGRVDAEPDAAPTPLSPSDPMFVETQDPTVHELAMWAWQASRGQRPRDYSLLDLAIRRGLPPEEVSEIAGLSRTGIYSVLGRLRGSFEESFSATALFYMGRQGCPELDSLATLGRELRPALRRDISRHAESCVNCRATLSGLPLASDLFAMIANVEMPADFQAHLSALYPAAAAPASAGGAGFVDASEATAVFTGIDALWDSEDDDVDEELELEDEPQVQPAAYEAPTVIVNALQEEPAVEEPLEVASLYDDEPEEEPASVSALYEEEPETEPEPEIPPPPRPQSSEVTLRAPRMPGTDPSMLTTVRAGRAPEPEPEAQPSLPSVIDSLYGGDDEEDELAPEELYEPEPDEEEPERIADRAVPLTFTRGGRGRPSDARAAAANVAPDKIRFERQDLYAKPSGGGGGGFGSVLGGGSRGVWIIALLIGIVLVSGYVGWAVGRSLDSSDGGNNAVAALPTRAGGVKVLPCGSGPVTVDQGSSATLSLDPKALNGYQVTGVTVTPVSPTSSATAVVAKTQGGNAVVFDAMFAPGAPNRLDEYKLSVTLTLGEKKAVSDCSVIVRAPATPIAAVPTATRPAAATTPGAGTTPAAGGTPAPAGTPGAAATRVP